MKRGKILGVRIDPTSGKPMETRAAADRASASIK